MSFRDRVERLVGRDRRARVLGIEVRAEIGAELLRQAKAGTVAPSLLPGSPNPGSTDPAAAEVRAEILDGLHRRMAAARKEAADLGNACPSRNTCDLLSCTCLSRFDDQATVWAACGSCDAMNPQGTACPNHAAPEYLFNTQGAYTAMKVADSRARLAHALAEPGPPIVQPPPAETRWKADPERERQAAQWARTEEDELLRQLADLTAWGGAVEAARLMWGDR